MSTESGHLTCVFQHSFTFYCFISEFPLVLRFLPRKTVNVSKQLNLGKLLLPIQKQRALKRRLKRHLIPLDSNYYKPSSTIRRFLLFQPRNTVFVTVSM